MTKPLIQIGDEIREMTDAELQQHLADKAAADAAQAELEAKATARAAVLNKLGLTADEAAALLG